MEKLNIDLIMHERNENDNETIYNDKYLTQLIRERINEIGKKIKGFDYSHDFEAFIDDDMNVINNETEQMIEIRNLIQIRDNKFAEHWLRSLC